MSGAGQTIPFGRAANQFARAKAWDQIQKTGRALPCSVVSAAGAIITVKFEILSNFTLPQIAVPLFGPQYVRYPMQPGDKGVVIAVDAQIGAMCGLGTGIADLTQPFNMGALVFLPIGNKQWPAVDPQSLTLYGPNGVVLYDTGKNSTLTLTPDGIVCVGKNNFSATVGQASVSMTTSQVEVAFGSNTILVNAGGVTITSDGEQIMSSNGTSMQIAWGANSVMVNASGTFISGLLTINGIQFPSHQHTGVSTGTGDTGPVLG